jgi:hypothetical protein
LEFPTSYSYKPSTSFLAPLPRRKKTFARGVSHAQSFTLFLFCFILFLLASFNQKYKKIVSFIVAFYLLAFSFVRMSNPEVEVRTFKKQGGESLKDACTVLVMLIIGVRRSFLP